MSKEQKYLLYFDLFGAIDELGDKTDASIVADAQKKNVPAWMEEARQLITKFNAAASMVEIDNDVAQAIFFDTDSAELIERLHEHPNFIVQEITDENMKRAIASWKPEASPG